ncbi:hypothetical protein D3C77_346230 [compost metagenome]
MEHNRAVFLELSGGFTHFLRQHLPGNLMVALLLASGGLTALLFAVQEDPGLVCVSGFPACPGLAAFQAFTLLLQLACLALTLQFQSLQGTFGLGAFVCLALGIDAVIACVAVQAQR